MWPLMRCAKRELNSLSSTGRLWTAPPSNGPEVESRSPPPPWLNFRTVRARGSPKPSCAFCPPPKISPGAHHRQPRTSVGRACGWAGGGGIRRTAHTKSPLPLPPITGPKPYVALVPFGLMIVTIQTMHTTKRPPVNYWCFGKQKSTKRSVLDDCSWMRHQQQFQSVCKFWLGLSFISFYNYHPQEQLRSSGGARRAQPAEHNCPW